MTKKTKKTDGQRSISIRERGKARRRERIIAAARHLIAEGGLEALSTRRLAEEAELSVHTLYKLVGSRDKIINAVMEENQQRVSSVLMESDASYGLDSIFTFVHETYGILAENEATQRPLMRALMQLYDAGQASEGIDAMMRQEQEWFVLSVAAARKQGLIDKTLSPHTLALSLMRAFTANMHQYLFDRVELEGFYLQTQLDMSLMLAAVANEETRNEYLSKARKLDRKLKALAR